MMRSKCRRSLSKTMRLRLASSLILLAAVFALLPRRGAAQTVFPDHEWASVEPAAAGWSPDKLKIAEAQARDFGSTSMVIVQGGKVVAAWGDPARKVRVASIRKSLLSALYGIAAADGRIDLEATLASLSIDDKPPNLTKAEKTATVRQLLAARSGVYHEAAAEPPSMKMRRPERGSHAPGTFWYYNNWDFNVLGTIYRQQAKEDIFKAFETRLARPIGMQDFTAADGKYAFAHVSEHPAYHFDLSARDLARFGWLYLNKGNWKGRQIVPAAWIDESTRLISDVDPGIGYGYMWWPSKLDSQRNVRIGPGTYSARGFGSQFLLVAPARDLVIAHLHADQMPEEKLARLLRLTMQAAPAPSRP